MTVTVKNNGALIVPPSVRRRAGIRAGDRLEFRVYGRVITIIPKFPVGDDEDTPQQHRRVDREIAQGLEDIRKGRTYGPFNSVQEMAASIEAEIRKSRLRKRRKLGR